MLSDPSAAVMLYTAIAAGSQWWQCSTRQRINYVSYVPEIAAESQLGTGQIEASQEQKLIDPALKAEL